MKNLIMPMLAAILAIGTPSVIKDNSHTPTNEVKTKQHYNSLKGRNNSQGQSYLAIDIEDGAYQPEELSFKLEVIANGTITNVITNANGLSTSSILFDEETYQAPITLSIGNGQIKGDLGIKVQTSEDEVALNIYALNTSNGVFLSTYSYTLAEDNYKAYLLANELITEEEYDSFVYNESTASISSQEINEELVELVDATDDTPEDEIVYVSYTDANNKTVHSKKTKAKKDKTTYLKGKVTWVDANKNIHPCINTYIEIYDDQLIGSRKLGSTYTNSNGEYTFTFQNDTSIFENGYDLFIKAFTRGKNTSVVKSIFWNTVYKIQSGVKSNVSTGYTTTINLEINDDNDAGKAMQVSQALIYGDKYVTEMNGKPATPCAAQYPQGDGCYEDLFGNLHITKFAYKFWDVILHEYGHHLQADYGLSNSLGGTHYVSSDNTSKHLKLAGLNLTWGESWPTVFGLQVSQYYASELKGIPYLNDSDYNAYYGETSSWDYSLENVYHASGEGFEDCTQAVLWDLYDNGTNESFDKIALGHKGLWNLMLSSKATTMSGFCNYVYTYGSVNVNDYSKLLAKYGMAPRGLSVKYDSTTGIPTFTWTPGGYKGGKTLQNRFQLVFYGSQNDVAFTSSTLSGNTNTTYTPSASQWEQILKGSGYKYSVRVNGKHYNGLLGFTSGWYYGELYTFDKPANAKVNGHYILTPKGYGFPQAYGSTEQSKTITINDLTLTTKRLRCGYIENEYINLSPRKSGAGTAYIDYTANKTIKTLVIDLSFWSSSEGLNQYNGSALIQYKDASGNWVTVTDLLKDYYLSTNREKQDTYTFTFGDKGTTEFRIYSTSLATGDRNKGRICIGKLFVY